MKWYLWGNAEAFRKGVVAEKVPLRCFDNAYQAGSFEKAHTEGRFSSAKGSQNTVFLEEAVRLLLQNPKDEEKLCRNSKKMEGAERDSHSVISILFLKKCISSQKGV